MDGGTGHPNQSVMEIEYQKLKDHQIVKRTVEPVGLMFSEYYFYLMGIITDSSRRGLSIKRTILIPPFIGFDRIHSVRETGEKPSVPYKDRFKEGRVQKPYFSSCSAVGLDNPNPQLLRPIGGSCAGQVPHGKSCR